MNKKAGKTGLGGFTFHHVPSCHLKCFHFWFLSGSDYSAAIFYYKFQRSVRSNMFRNEGDMRNSTFHNVLNFCSLHRIKECLAYCYWLLC